MRQIRRFKANTRNNWSLGLEEVWQERRLIPFLAWREIASRYRVLPVGLAWSVAQPLCIALIAAFFFNQLGRLPAAGLPYPVFTFAGTAAWQYLANTAATSAAAPMSFGTLLKKIYFPRLILPMTLCLCPIIDLVAALAALVIMSLLWQVPVHPDIFSLPLLAMLTVITGLGIASWFSALSFTYYDIRHLIPFVMHLWFLSSPVLYPASIIPEQFRLLYYINPAAGIVSGLRWSLFHVDQPSSLELAASMVCAVLFCLSGLFCYKNLSRRFADIV